MADPTTPEKPDSIWKAFIAPIITGIVVGIVPIVVSQCTTTLHDKQAITQALIQELASGDALKIDLALALMEESLGAESTKKYRTIVDNHLKRAVEVSWSSPSPGSSSAKANQGLAAFEAIRPEWKALIQKESKKFREAEEKKLEMAKQKEIAASTAQSEFSNLLDLGKKRLDQKDCYGAYVAFSGARDISRESQAAASGMTIAENCLTPEGAQRISQMEGVKAQADAVKDSQRLEAELRETNKAMEKLLKNGPDKKRKRPVPGKAPE